LHSCHCHTLGGQLFNPGILGVESFVLGLVAFYLSSEYYNAKKVTGEGEKPELLWFKIILFPAIVLACFEVIFCGSRKRHQISRAKLVEDLELGRMSALYSSTCCRLDEVRLYEPLKIKKDPSFNILIVRNGKFLLRR